MLQGCAESETTGEYQMPIRRRIRMAIPKPDIRPVDELIAVRRQQHGGSRGAPKKTAGGQRVGAALNKSCILMMSALLQGYVEDVFLAASQRLFKTLADEAAQKRYAETLRATGNPSSENIARLFLRIGKVDVFDGLSWQKASMKQIKEKLRDINELRNKIAHGKALPEAVSLTKVETLRNFVDQFGSRFARSYRRILVTDGVRRQRLELAM